MANGRLQSHQGGVISVREWFRSPDLTSGLRLAVGRRRRTGTMLRHELVELFLVLGMTQAIKEFTKLLLLVFEPPQRLHAVLVKGAVAAGRRAEREAAALHAALHALHLGLHPLHLV